MAEIAASMVMELRGRTGRQAGLGWINPTEFPTGETPLPRAAA